MWARIEDNRVLEVTNSDPAGRFHPSIAWISVPNGTEAGMVKSGSNYVWPDTGLSAQVRVITRRQGRLALLQAGKLDLVESALDAIADTTEKKAAQIEYEADTWELDNPFLQSMWSQLSGTEQELNDLFTLAKTL